MFDPAVNCAAGNTQADLRKLVDFHKEGDALIAEREGRVLTPMIGMMNDRLRLSQSWSTPSVPVRLADSDHLRRHRTAFLLLNWTVPGSKFPRRRIA